MKTEKKRDRADTYGIRRRIMVWAVLVIMGLCSLIVIQGILLDNAGKMGSEMAYSYSAESSRKVIMYETMMRQSTRYIDQQLSGSEAPEEWMMRTL